MKFMVVKTDKGLRGATADDHNAWTRFRAALDRVEPGTWFQLEITRKRSGKQHRKFFALVELITENSELYNTKAKALVAIKLSAGFFDPYIDPTTGEVIKVPQSIAYENMEQGEFNSFFDQAVTATCMHIIPQFDERQALLMINEIIAGWGG